MIRRKKNKNGQVVFEAAVMIQGRKLYKRFGAYQEGQAWINQVRYHRDGGQVCTDKITMQTLFNNYLKAAEHKDNSPNTMRNSKAMFKNHILPFYGEANVFNITLLEHKAFMDNLIEKHLENATRNRIRALLSVMYSTAIREELSDGAIDKNPFLKISKAKEMAQRMDYWNTEEINQFLAHERDSHYYPLWVLMLNIGLRIGEAVGVHAEQIDRVANILTVDRQWCHVSRIIRYRTKGVKIRHIGLNKVVQQTLYPLVKDGPIFKLQNGDLLATDYISKKVFPRACKAAGVRKIRIHDLRHTFASQFMMSNGNIYDLQKILGHSSVKTTERYSHFSMHHIQSQAEVVSFGGDQKIILVDFKKKAIND